MGKKRTTYQRIRKRFSGKVSRKGEYVKFQKSDKGIEYKLFVKEDKALEAAAKVLDDIGHIGQHGPAKRLAMQIRRYRGLDNRECPRDSGSVDVEG